MLDPFLAATADTLVVLPDNRRVRIIKSDILIGALGDFVVDQVEELANAANAKKGA